MKQALFILNIFLAAVVLFCGFRLYRQKFQGNKVAFTVKKRTGTVSAKKSVPVAKTVRNQPAANLDKLARRIVEQNIFNPDRCPNAMNFSNARVDLTLVGTFKINGKSGAIILQKSQNRNFNPFQGMPMPPDMPGGNPRRMGIERGGMNTGYNRSQANRTSVNTRRVIGGARSIQVNRNAGGVVLPGQQTSSQQTTMYKQYVRVGETLANGYKLIEVERNRAVLTRGGDKLELELADASKNQKKTTGNRNRKVSQNQVMQQMMNNMQNMQRMQMMQNFQMMRMNQNMNNFNNPGGRNGTAPRRR